MLLLIFTLTAVSTIGSAQANGIGTQPECPPGIPLTAATDINGVPLCAVDAVDFCPDPLDTFIDNIGNCQPESDAKPVCPAGTTLDFDICTVPSTCPSGTTLDLASLLCITTGQPAVGGTIIPIDTTSLLLAGAQSTTWLIPIVLSLAGIGLVLVKRKQ